jgi:hypothetical protein
MKRRFGLLVPLPVAYGMLLITASIWCMPDSTQALAQFTLTVSKEGTGSGTVTSSPAGITCDSTCLAVSAAFDQGTSVTLTASATNDSRFTGWSGEGCSGTGTVSMTQARNVTATFIPFAAPVIEHPTDFDGDSKADILWRHTQTGEVVVWLMHGMTMAGAAVVAQVSDPGWQIMGVGDVDGDGKADLVWHHRQTGMVVIWRLDGLTVLEVRPIATVDDLGWQIQ